jgi:hypothetical protein
LAERRELRADYRRLLDDLASMSSSIFLSHSHGAITISNTFSIVDQKQELSTPSREASVKLGQAMEEAETLFQKGPLSITTPTKHFWSNGAITALLSGVGCV